MDFRVYAEEYLSLTSVIDAAGNVKLEIVPFSMAHNPKFYDA
jgi:hypothetical protein